MQNPQDTVLFQVCSHMPEGTAEMSVLALCEVFSLRPWDASEGPQNVWHHHK